MVVEQSNLSGYSNSKNSSQLEGWVHFKSINDIMYYSTSIYPSESGKCGKEEKKLQKSEYVKSKTSFLNDIQGIFVNF